MTSDMDRLAEAVKRVCRRLDPDFRRVKELATADWFDWYCHRRLHGEIGHIPPVEYETKYYRETTKYQVTVKI